MGTVRSRTIALVPVLAGLLASCDEGSECSDRHGGVAEKTNRTRAAQGEGAGSAHTRKQPSGRSKAPAKPKAKPRKRSSAGAEVLQNQAQELEQQAGKPRTPGRKKKK